MARLLLLAFLALTLDAQVKINEVLFNIDPNSSDTFRTEQWLELFNAGTDAVDLTGWALTGADGVNGASARPLPSVMLPAGAYLVVHLASGTNSLDFTGYTGDYYTGDSGQFWSIDADEAALYSPNGIVDFINWARSSVFYVPGQALQDAVAANIWSDGAVLLHDQIGLPQMQLLRTLQPGDSIGRDANSTDTDDVGDFDALGGQAGLGPTPGGQNLTALTVTGIVQSSAGSDRAAPRVSPAGAAPKPKANWTVLLYVSSDNELEGTFAKNEIVKIEQTLRGIDNNNVNFVALWDTQTLATGTLRGRLLPLGDDGSIFMATPDGVPNIGKRDLGDPSELSSFIAWAKANYPADHYGIVFSSHGAGWKGFGPDRTFPQGTREKVDWLYMGELSSALNGQNLDWIAFHACMMAGVEVAHQLKSAGHYLLASEEIATSGDFPYDTMVQHMIANPGWDALASVTDIFNEYVNRVKQGGVVANNNYTVSVTDLTKVNDLSVNIRAWADLLAPGMSLFFGRDDPSDNAQILTKKSRDGAETYSDKNFIDLYHFSSLMNTSGLPQCLLSPVPSILDIIAHRVVILESHGTNHPNSHGLHIYFPGRRMIPVVLGADGLLTKDPATGLTGPIYFTYVQDVANPNPPPATVRKIVQQDSKDQPYDLPKTRTFDGSSPLAHYGINADQLPLKARDPETGIDFDLPGNGLSIVWPLPQSPGFLFPNDTGWRKVLDRFYHPAADNHILPVKLADGTTVNPVQTGGGACANPTDTITVPLGTTVTFSAKGSSDADMPGVTSPLHNFWDLNDKVGCTAGCIAPFQVGAGTDAATAPTNMDADQDRNFTTIDQHDGDSVTITRVCDVAGPIKVTLMPWDDDHLFPFHNTTKTAEYVHPQSNLHQAIMNCTSPVTQFPTSGTLMLTFTVISDQFTSDPFVGLGGQMAMVHFTTSSPAGINQAGSSNEPAAATQTITLTGDRNAIPNGSGTYDPTNGTWNATILASGNIAGFPNVEVKWVNMQFTGPGNNSVTGTYEVGTNGNLNGEPQPITYKVTGTVTRQ